MERMLNGTMMGNAKLRANIVKFVVENVGLLGDEKMKKEKVKEKVLLNEPSVFSQHFRVKSQVVTNQGSGKLYSEVVAKPQGTTGEALICWQETVINVQEDINVFQGLYGKTLVGRCVTYPPFENSISSLQMRATYFPRIELFNNLNTWNCWFSKLVVCRGQEFLFERIAWVRVCGVPLHSADNCVFDSIIGKFGKVIYESQVSSEDEDLFVNCLDILVDC
ncbi:hypothetical protein Hanom_Chr09g00760511 [Helianthus anomalus]